MITNVLPRFLMKHGVHTVQYFFQAIELTSINDKGPATAVMADHDAARDGNEYNVVQKCRTEFE